MRSRILRALAVCAALAVVVGLRSDVTLRASVSGVVVSQVYGGGGNSGATFKNDFIELFNAGPAPVSLTGWSVQYGASAGSSWLVTSLSGSLAPGQYYLIQEAAGAAGTTSLPAPDSAGNIAMSAGAGKVALVPSTTALTGCPPSTSVIDLVGYGTGTNCFEGAVTPALTNTTAAIRKNNGAQDTDNNSNDFLVAAPTPRNSAFNGTTNPTASGSANPASVQAGATTLLTVAVTPGANPTSTGINVTANLTPIGGASAQSLFDDGTHGDATAGDNVFSFLATVAGATTSGTKNITASVTDAQSRTGAATIGLTITATSTSPSATGSASPASLRVGDTTLLTARVTPGTNPSSTSITVVGDLSAIGGSNTVAFHDDGQNGDIAANDNIFSVQATIGAGTPTGSKTIPVTVSDAQARTAAASIAVTVLPPPPPTTIKISQVYAGGGNSGSTYTNDFIELFNEGPTPIDLTGWSVQYHSAASDSNAWFVTPLCPGASPCAVQPGHYLLVQEGAGSTGTTGLPVADVIGTIGLGAANGKVALVADTTPIAGNTCSAPGTLVDLLGYGSATCFDGSAGPVLGNLVAAIRNNNGCVDTDNNGADFFADSPIPRNSASPINGCGGDATQLSGWGRAVPSGVDPGATTLLTVAVIPATLPVSSGLSVSADLTNIGGAASQPFFDDGTHGDVTAGDHTFSFGVRLPAGAPTGVRSVLVTVRDNEARSLAAGLALSVLSPTCGVERWSVKVGTDPDAATIDLQNRTAATIAQLRGILAPATPPDNARVLPTEGTVYVINGVLMQYKKETDVDYHLVLQDGNDLNTMIAEIPLPGCSSISSPVLSGILEARTKFDARFAATPFFQDADVPVQVTGVGFFDFIHGQTGVAPNGIELHPVLQISFTANTTTTVMSNSNPSQFGEAAALTALVTNGLSTAPTGNVTFFDNGNPYGSPVALDPNGQATVNTASLNVGSHTITASYEGDSTSAPSSTAAALVQIVNKADQTVTFAPLANKTFKDPDFAIDATASSGLPVVFTLVSGPAMIGGTTIHILGAGTVTVRASQPGDDSYNAAPDVERSFVVAPAAQTIGFEALPNRRYGEPPFIVHATGGASGNPVTFAAAGNCSASGTNGSTITVLAAGSCVLTASQAATDNYSAAADVSQPFTINKAEASITVAGYSGTYDGQPHGATGSATGVNNEPLTTLLNFGQTFTNAPGGTAHWSFAGDANYDVDEGTATIAIGKAAPSIAALVAPAVELGSSTATISGAIGFGSLVPTGSVSIGVGGGTAPASISEDGHFSAAVPANSLTLAASPYTVTVTYGGDTNFTGASGMTSLAVVDTTAPVISAASAAPGVLEPPNHDMIPVAIDYSVVDLSGATCRLSVASNEPLNGTGDGNTSIDWQVLDAHHVLLRAERAGTGTGRVYTVTVTCTDPSQNGSVMTTGVSVPK